MNDDLTKKTLFNPNRIQLPENLILIPQFWEQKYYKKIKDSANGCMSMMSSEFLLFDNYTILVNFLGYPHIITMLEFIEDARNKNVYFLGTAGSLNPQFDHPMPLVVKEIYSTAVLDHFCDKKSFSLNVPSHWDMTPAKGVTVDIIQRETVAWLREQVERKIDFVEMEIFPLASYLEKSFTAAIITSDLLKETGIEVFLDRKLLLEEFIKAFELMVKDVS